MRRAAGRIFRSLRGASSLDDDILRRNLSFVLHEHSRSGTVRDTAAACQAHARVLPHIAGNVRAVFGVDEFLAQPARTVLTSSLGVPRALAQIAAAHPNRPDVLFADRGVQDGSEVQLFRAPARLALPASNTNDVLVAAAILRPSGSSIDLRWEGPFQWPADQDLVLRALERLIQPFASQWMPMEPLWSGPAEQLLGDEIQLRRSKE